jgi:hypothetical protein
MTDYIAFNPYGTPIENSVNCVWEALFGNNRIIDNTFSCWTIVDECGNEFWTHNKEDDYDNKGKCFSACKKILVKWFVEGAFKGVEKMTLKMVNYDPDNEDVITNSKDVCCLFQQQVQRMSENEWDDFFASEFP